MTPNTPEILRERGRSLEDEFFRREDQRLMETSKVLRAAEAIGRHSQKPPVSPSRPSSKS
jgi:hypothetical protein